MTLPKDCSVSYQRDIVIGDFPTQLFSSCPHSRSRKIFGRKASACGEVLRVGDDDQHVAFSRKVLNTVFCLKCMSIRGQIKPRMQTLVGD